MLFNLISDYTLLRAVVYVEDALSYKSLRHRCDMLSLQLYRITHSTAYRYSYNVVIAVVMLLAFVETPSSLSHSADSVRNPSMTRYELPFGLTHTVELLCIVCFMLDFVLRWRLSGIPFWRSKWLLAYGVVNCLHLLCFFLFIGTRKDQLRMYRLIRPFYMVQKSSIMKKMLHSIKKSMVEIFGVLSVLGLNLLVFALGGLIIFSDNGEEVERYFKTIGTALWSLLVLITTANNPDVMIPAYSNNRLFALFFIIFIWLAVYSLMNLLLAVIYNQFRRHFKLSVHEMLRRRQVALRAAFEVLVQSPRNLNNTGEIFGNSTNDSFQNSLDSSTPIIDDMPSYEASAPSTCFIEISTLVSIVNLLNVNRKYKEFLGSKIESGEYILTDQLDGTDFVALFIDIEHDFALWEQRQTSPSVGHPFIRRICDNRFVEMIGTLLAVGNTTGLMIVLNSKVEHHIHRGAESILVLNAVITVYYTLEQILRLLGHGVWAYLTTLSYVWDGSITLCLVVLEIMIYARQVTGPDDYYHISAIRATNLFILLRFARVMFQVKSLSNVLQTYLVLIKKMQVFLAILIALMYIFAIVGMELFSSDVTPLLHNASAVHQNKTLANECGSYWNLNYYPINFDDFAASLVTLFTLMVVNNWHIIVDAFTLARGPWARAYFILWWIVSVLLVFNIITAMILDAFIARWDAQEKPVTSGVDFTVAQFVDDQDRARPIDEHILISALYDTKVVKLPFTRVRNIEVNSEVSERDYVEAGPSIQN